MIPFKCPTCSTCYSVPDDRAGGTARCAKCGNHVAVPSAPTMQADQVGVPLATPVTVSASNGETMDANHLSSRKMPTPLIAFLCPKCLTGYQVPDDKAGKKTRCPACGENLTVPVPERAKSMPGQQVKVPEQSRQVADNSPGPLVPLSSVIMWVIGVVLLIAAFIVNNSLDARDARQGRIDGALHRFSVNIGGPTNYREGPKSDRTPVYLLTGLGGISILLGFVCAGVSKGQ